MALPPSIEAQCARVQTTLLAVLLAWAVRGAGAAERPDFSPYVAIDSETVAPGKIAGVIRNVGSGPLRNVVLQVRHGWRWSAVDGAEPGRLSETRRVVISDLVLPGAVKGFASIHAPGSSVPPRARYSCEISVIEITTVGLAAD